MVDTNRTLNHEGANPHGSLICWKSVIAGVLVSSLAYMTFAALGTGIGGLTVYHVIQKGGMDSGAVTAAGLWIGGSAVIALFLGAYFATRFSDVTHNQIGASQGIVIAAIFFYLLVNFAGASVGSMTEVANHFSRPSAVSEAEATAKAVGEAGWLLFATLLLGVAAAVLGGIEGAHGNVRRPFSRRRES